ncbi:site-specific DNA-methyltransferase [Phascolarctobacterium succinatutens]|uniref:site-specific DNA-methyltransferase n=1 Tax=Phascolarctobacterium succinatutens TaxID=626940 RepID=UPI0023F6C2C9|nr:site-specific DNA-methyltransferase [Phascolarctobacterium succinatutens]
MMEHLNMQSMDKVAANVAKIRELFPNCVTERINSEGKLEHAIDFDMLKQELSDHVVDGLQERYQFTWPDKRKAILAANAPINKTLRPCREESVDFDNTENLYIEGDNLEVLKLLQETYLGKVKMIYIDPPYNTGNDFVYEDDFKQNSEEYIVNSGQLDDEGNRLVVNTESNGRFHTDWLNMIYPRLKLAKDLLSDDGVIFISIGDDEESNLIKCCNEIFGESNFIASICHKHRASVSNDRIISENHNHLLFYCKNIVSVFRNHKLIGEDPVLEGFNLEDEKGKYKLTPVDVPGGAKKGNPHYNFLGVTGYWRYSKETMQKKYDEGLIVRTTNGLQQKYYLSQASKSRKTVTTWWDDDFLTSSATKMLINLMGDKTFDNPKNINLIIRCLKMIVKFDKDSLIIDFFSGSATTAHAVMQLNAEDGGKRKFIMVQLPEVCAENSEAYKAGYKNICEIGKERIRRAGKKIKEENPLTTQNLDIGFRVLKCDSSNMEDVYFTPKEYMDKQQSLFIDNIKKDRSDEDLLFDAMLKLDTPLSSKIEKISIAGKTVYNVAQGHLMACFDKNVTDEVITAIAKEMPSYFVMRDSSQADDSVAINFEQIFNTYSPQTVRRVL